MGEDAYNALLQFEVTESSHDDWYEIRIEDFR